MTSWVSSFYFELLLGSQPLQSTLTNEASRTVSIKKLKGSTSPLRFPDLLPLTSLPPSAARGCLWPIWLQPPAFQKPCPRFWFPDAWNSNLWNCYLKGSTFPLRVCDNNNVTIEFWFWKSYQLALNELKLQSLAMKCKNITLNINRFLSSLSIFNTEHFFHPYNRKIVLLPKRIAPLIPSLICVLIPPPT